MRWAWIFLGACRPIGDEPAASAPVVVRANPNGLLSPFVVVDAPEGAEVTVQLVDPDGETIERSASWDGEHHVAWVWGLRPELDYEVVAQVNGAALAAIPLSTEALPFPAPLARVVADEAGRDAGLTLFFTHVRGEVLCLGYDPAGRVVWYYDVGPADTLGTASVQLLPDGNLALLLDGELRVITPDGRLVHSIAATYSHDAVFLPGGHVLYLTDRMETYEIPGLGGTFDVLIDGVVEIDEAGAVVGEWWASDDLDVQRFDSALSRGNELGNSGLDWGHANALSLRDDGLVLVSLRHQSWVVALDWTTHSKRWVLGKGGDFSIANEADWFDSQHSPHTMPDGSLLIYDNGVERSPPYTRVMQMAVDEEAFTASLMWSFRLNVFTAHAGDVDPLPNGNVLVTAGEPSNLNQLPRIFEATNRGQVVWQIDVDGPPIYRATRIAGF